MCRRLFYLTNFVLVLVIIQGGLAFGFDANADPSLVGYWKLDDGSGTIAVDSSPNGNDGTLEGDPQWVEGWIDGAMDFDGDGDAINFGNDQIFNITEQITLAVWVNTRDMGNSENNPWLGKGDNAYMIKGFRTGYDIEFFIYDGDWNSAHYITDESFNNEWHHVAGTYDGTQLLIYVDGVVGASLPLNSTINVTTHDVALATNTQEGGRFYDGFLDEARIYNRALTAAEIQTVMAGGGEPGRATDPVPEDDGIDVMRDVILSWTPGVFADKHDVYLGTSFDDVNNAGTDSPLLVGPAQDANSYSAGRLELERTYFWRVDEINKPPDTMVFKGDIWSFTIEPYVYPIPAESIIATASSQVEGDGPENTINSSGLDVNDLHSTDTDSMWLSDISEPGSVWIQYEFDKAYKLHQMLVWNYNGPLILYSYGFKGVVVEYSADGTNWMQIDNVTEFTQAPGARNYANNTTVDFNNVAVKYVKITANSNWSGGFLNQYGLSEVRFLNVPVSAREPSPADGATEVDVDVNISWRAGREAAEHNIYLSTDQQSLINGTTPAVTVPQANYGPSSLNLGDTYYWRIDEVNNAESVPIWKGNIWSFEVQKYFVIDDFESYNDLNPEEQDSNRIYLTWVDGFDNPSVNGSTMGYPSPEFANDEHFVETGIVHGDEQSAPLFYDNRTASYSEVTVSTDDLLIGPDWSKGGARTLVLWFFGDPDNSITEQLYVKINGTKVLYDGDQANIAVRRWTQWNIDLTSLGVNLGNVTTFSIGFERTGATGGSGVVFIDDIRLYRTAPPIPVPTEPAVTGLVAYYSFENNVQDGSGNGLDGTVMGEPTFVAGVTGLALALDGVDDYVDCGNSASFDITEEITLSAWVNTSDSGNGEHNPFVGKGDHTYAIKHSDANNIQFFIYDGEWFTANVEVDESFNGDWRFVAGTYDGNELKIYIDGGLRDVTAHVGAIETTTDNLAIGTNSEASGRFYSGVIDEVRIYNRALSEGEILYLADQYIQ
jgi:hypothetical protein